MTDKLMAAIRLHDWWHFIIPPILGFYFLGIQYSTEQHDPETLIRGSVVLLLLALPVASFGFFLNEWTDIREDAIAGKKNYASAIRPIWRPFIFLIISVALILVLFLPGISSVIQWLVGVQILSFVLYSSPYLRLKEWPLAAILLDALYSGTIFYIIALLLINNYFPWYIYTGVFAFGIIRGIRNIIFHLQQDQENDSVAGKRTLAHLISEKGMIRSQEFLWILEVLIMLLLCFHAGPITFVILLTGFVMIIIKRHFYVSNRQEGNKDNRKWLGELNTLYELWFMAATITGAFIVIGWLPLIIAWLAMFFLFPYSRKLFNELYIGAYNVYYFISDLYFVYTKPHFDIGKILRRIFK